MSLENGCRFGDFFDAAYDAGTSEPYGSRFKEYSKTGNREKMIEVLLEIPCIRETRICERYKGKDDAVAARLYDEFQGITLEDLEEHGKSESRACNTLREALFAASASSGLFLDALLACAKYSYDLKAFVRCIKYCECMLALPESFYGKTAENANHFRKCREECVALKRECTKNLDMANSEKKKARGKRTKGPVASSEQSTTKKHPAKIPPLDGKRHKYIECCSDAVTLNFNEEKGRYLVATRNIKAGTVLIVDQPFSFSTEVGALKRNCLHCHDTLKLEDAATIPCHRCRTVSFCSEKCRDESWRLYHRYECPVFDFFFESNTRQQTNQSSHLLLAYRTTVLQALSSSDGKESLENCEVPVLNENFLRVHTAHEQLEENNNTENNKVKKPGKLGFSERYSPRDYRTVLEMETHCAEAEAGINIVRAIQAIFLAKCFVFVLSKMDSVCVQETFISLAVAMLHHLQAINCNAYETVENVRGKESHVWEPRYVGGAIYPTVSLVNHSCYPNTVRHSYPHGVVVVRATRFIGKGSEVLDCYGPHFLSDGRLTRREYLWKKYRFLCACQACTQNWQIPLPETFNYKCRACSAIVDTLVPSKKEGASTRQCPQCREKVDWKKMVGQLSKSIEKRTSAVKRMYEGRYEEALPLLLEHIHFIEKFFAAPNIETIKTQQCIIQCYNYFGCTSQ